MTRAFRVSVLTAAILGGVGVPLLPANAAGAGSVSGVAFEDTNRNGVQDAGEPGFSGHGIWLTSSSGSILGAATDSAGNYSFGSLAPDTYRVEYDNSTNRSMRDEWVPTTTGSLRAAVSVVVSGAARANFGWRRIVRSTTLGAPIDAYTGPSGLRVESYDDVVSAKTVHDVLASGSLTAEAPKTTIRFDYGSTSVTSTGAGQDATGSYSSYSAASYVTYASWRDAGPVTLVHEYGHAWSQYHAYISQQDPDLNGYLQARGIAGDSRLRTSMAWDPAEMIAEDYRQLFGVADAASAPQMNRDLPPAAQVAGLRDYLAGAFTQPVAAAAPAPAALVIDATSAVTSRRGIEIGYRLSEGCSVTVKITDTSGRTLRTVITNAAAAAGATTTIWDGKDDAGRKLKTSGLLALVSGSTSDGRVASATQRLP